MNSGMRRTEFEGFPVSYGLELAGILNDSIGGRNLSNRELLVIGKAVSANVRHLLHPMTRDGYFWHGELEFEVGNARVAILFPQERNSKYRKDRMDRPIEVYSDRELSPIAVRNLLVTIARQAYLKFPLRNERVLH